LQVTNGYHAQCDPSVLREWVDNASTYIKEWRDEYHKQNPAARRLSHIVCRGMSGASLAFPISYNTDIPVVYVRKQHESEHCSRLLVGDGWIEDYIIVDDDIASGKTIFSMLDTIKRAHASQWLPLGVEPGPLPECKGIFLLNQRRSTRFNLSNVATNVANCDNKLRWDEGKPEECLPIMCVKDWADRKHAAEALAWVKRRDIPADPHG
jgi:hypothetical protein